MNFSDALTDLRNGFKITRTGWNGPNMWLKIQIPDAHPSHTGIKMTLPYIYMFTSQGDLVPWLASQTDILSDDWEIVPIMMPRKTT